MGFISIVKTVIALVPLPSLFLGEDKISVALLPVSISAQGASTGAIKLWDLEEAKSNVVARTLTGHRINCTAIEFHPFG
ncbi:PREDICTED: katanin p80 WD40 repeat-containing subunit B1 homolog [Nelumbo nucifera]|uniref:Katanin p80 WD40 repeat-containing subunit B1 homolog n=1 Tax=Nelumbo nucifera TaxID=4432 RepID=A0A1U7YT54_NELNU|nr:PREDICTED: katanin p80 WD40 repeat-containing subunit B1 homolog [Nelumbo nucifera]